jgi:hypothetical protein
MGEKVVGQENSEKFQIPRSASKKFVEIPCPAWKN